jgi:C-terminal processing protease CtpA/Prc
MLRNFTVVIFCLTAFTIPANAYPAPRPEEPPQKAHGCLGVDLTVERDGRITFKRIRKDSPADRAGLHFWDVLVEIDGRPIDDANNVLDRIASCRPGSVVPITVVRGSELLTVYAKVGCRSATISDTESNPDSVTIINGEEQERQTGVIEGVGEEFLQ